MIYAEHNIQRIFVQWFRLQYRQYAPLCFAVPNGGARNTLEAARLKAEGVRAGVADILICVPRGGYGCLGLEFKTARGRQSDAQKAWQAAFEQAGNMYAVVRSVGEAADVVRKYMMSDETDSSQED